MKFINGRKLQVNEYELKTKLLNMKEKILDLGRSL